MSARWIGLPVLFLATAAFVLVPGQLYGPGLDATVFALVAWRMRDGAVPYLDTWDHKPPGIYLVEWFGQLILPGVDWWIVSWLVTVIALVATGLTLRATLIRAGCPRWATLGGLLAVVAAGQYVMSLGGGLTEQVATAPAAAALLAALSRMPGRWLLAGALLAAAVLVTLQVAPIGLALLVLALTDAGPRGVLRRVTALAVGALVVALAVVAWLGVLGALPAAFDQVIAYNTAYRSLGQEPQRTVRVAAISILSLLFVLVPALVGLVGMRRASSEKRRLGLAALSWMVGVIVVLGIAGGLFTHYLAPTAVPLAILAVLGAEDVAAGRRALPALGFAAVSVFLVAAAVSGVSMAWFAMGEGGENAALRQRIAVLAPAVHSRSDPNDRLFVWGNAPGTYLETDRAPAGPYAYLYPLTTPGYSSPDQIDRLLRAWAEQPPALVVDAGSARPGAAGFAPLLVDRPVVDFDPRRLDLLDPLRAFIQERYELVADADGWLVYGLPDSSEIARH